jgi:hypothetical protein
MSKTYTDEEVEKALYAFQMIWANAAIGNVFTIDELLKAKAQVEAVLKKTNGGEG